MPDFVAKRCFMKENSGRKFTTIMLVMAAVMSAIGVVLALYIHFPLIPAVPFLEYDPADIVIYICTYVFGIPIGIAMTVVVSVVQGLTVSGSSGPIGIVMHIISTGGFVLAAGLVYRALAPKNGSGNSNGGRMVMRLAFATAAGILTTILLMTLWNILLTPIFMQIDRAVLIKEYLWLIVLFNIIKASINGVAAAVLTVPFRLLAKRFYGEGLVQK